MANANPQVGAGLVISSERTPAKTPWMKVFGAFLSVIVFFVVLSIPIAGLKPEGQGVLATLAAAIVLWVTGPIPIGFTALLACVVPWVMGWVKIDVAFSGFAGSAFWLMVAAVGIASCINASGISKRIVLWMLSFVGNPTYKRILLMTFALLFLLSYILPSCTGRIAVTLALLMPIVAIFGVSNKSNVGKGLALSVVIVGLLGGGAVLTGSAPTIVANGVLTQMGLRITWAQWALIAFVPTLLTLVFFYPLMLWLVKPEKESGEGGAEKLKADLKALGPVTLMEMRGFAITGLIVVLWMLDPFLHIGTTQVGMLGLLLFVMPGIGVMSFGDLMKKGIFWEMTVMVGAIMSISGIVGVTGVGPLVTGSVIGPLYSVANSILTFTLTTFGLNLFNNLTMLFLPTIGLVAPTITSTAQALGINQLASMILFVGVSPAFVFWQMAPMVALGLSTGAMDIKDFVKGGLLGYLANVIAWLIAIFIWVPLLTSLGLI